MKRYFYSIIAARPREPLGFVLRFILLIISLLYLLAVKLRLVFYNLGVFRVVGLKAPVISVGNITWGGGGKTPLVEAICLYFKSRGERIALLTRGYGMDEDKVLTKSLPGVSVLVGKDRVGKIRLAEEKGSVFDLFILDDGFQHQRIRRDIDIVAINATDPFGSGLLVPAGILREPISHLCRADLAVITKSNLAAEKEINRLKNSLLKINPGVEVFTAIHQPLSFYAGRSQELPLEYIKGKTVCAFSGLADNRSFIRTLKDLGADIGLEFLYMDHHRYKKSEMDRIIKECRRNRIDTAVTTQKDGVKLKGLLTEPGGIEFLVLKIRLKINDEEGFFRRLSSILSG